MVQNRETLLALADRAEKATGPDARLGAEIQIARGRFPERAYAQRNGMRPKGSPELDRIDFMAIWDLDPTASLDVAMSLYIDLPTQVPSNPRLAAAEALRQRAEAV